MESMDKLSLIVQIFWLIIILSSIYLLVLRIMIPRIKKVLKIRKELYESKIKKLYEIKFKEYLIKWQL
jgi:F0F1-type ATP synthase membrane subunit b/b'